MNLLQALSRLVFWTNEVPKRTRIVTGKCNLTGVAGQFRSADTLQVPVGARWHVKFVGKGGSNSGTYPGIWIENDSLSMRINTVAPDNIVKGVFCDFYLVSRDRLGLYSNADAADTTIELWAVVEED